MDAPEAWRSYATICRLCLQKEGFMLGIFNHIQSRDKSIYKKIIDCTALQISHGDGLPNVICHRCLYKIEFCLEFRQLCFLSDATLRQLTNTTNKENGPDSVAQFPLYEQLSNGNDEDVVMVVDPTAPDYNSDYESDNHEQPISENENVENTDTFETRNVSMCRYCDQAFTDKQECLDHETSVHNSEFPYQCKDCSMDFADRLQYSAHLKSVHQNEKPYNCPQCDRTFARRSDLRKHTVVHTGVKPFTCNVCFKSFSRNTNLSKHMKIHAAGKKPFCCRQCPKTFIYKGDLFRHAIVHTRQKPFSCNYCKMSFMKRDKLLRHEKGHFPQDNSEDKSQELQIMRENLSMDGFNYAQNSNSGNFEDAPLPEDVKVEISENMVINLDPFSHNNFGNGDVTPHRETQSEPEPNNEDLPRVPDHIKDEPDLPSIPAHISNNSSKPSNGKSQRILPKRYSCSTCYKKFSSPDNLKYHQATHSGIRPYSCNTCSKSFIRKRELDRHVATHTGMKPFKCSKCSKSFGRKDKLVRHMRIHDVKKEHNCHLCGATFNRRDGLNQHLRTHVKEEQD